MPDNDSTSSSTAAVTSANGTLPLVRVQIAPDDLTYEAIKAAIYSQARYLYERGQKIRRLLLSKDVHEILSKRLVFKTAAHKDLPQFITPFGNLRVVQMDASLDEPLSFIIEC